MTDTILNGGDDQARLVRFVQTTQKDLGSILEQSRLWFDPADADLIDLARESFGELVVQFEQMTKELIDGWERRHNALRDHGLIGTQLKFKLAVSERARNRFVESVSDGERQAPWSGILAERYLAAADIILESLSDALGGAGKAIGEFKKMIEWLLNKSWRGWRWA